MIFVVITTPDVWKACSAAAVLPVDSWSTAVVMEDSQNLFDISSGNFGLITSGYSNIIVKK